MSFAGSWSNSSSAWPRSDGSCMYRMRPSSADGDLLAHGVVRRVEARGLVGVGLGQRAEDVAGGDAEAVAGCRRDRVVDIDGVAAARSRRRPSTWPSDQLRRGRSPAVVARRWTTRYCVAGHADAESACRVLPTDAGYAPSQFSNISSALARRVQRIAQPSRWSSRCRLPQWLSGPLSVVPVCEVGAPESGVVRVPQLDTPPLVTVWSGSGFGPLIAPMPMPVCADAIGAAHPHAAMTIAAIHVRRFVPMAQADQAGLTKH